MKLWKTNGGDKPWSKKSKPSRKMTLGSHEAIGVKWMFKIKKNAKGEVERYKVRLVSKGCKQ
ncbi:hypothetical protein CR513_18069, partial [Mucuna pruriens]